MLCTLPTQSENPPDPCLVYGSGSKSGTQNGLLVDGSTDRHLFGSRHFEPCEYVHHMSCSHSRSPCPLENWTRAHRVGDRFIRELLKPLGSASDSPDLFLRQGFTRRGTWQQDRPIKWEARRPRVLSLSCTSPFAPKEFPAQSESTGSAVF